MKIVQTEPGKAWVYEVDFVDLQVKFSD